MYRVSTEQIEDSGCYRVNIYDDENLVAGILTYERNETMAMSHAKNMIRHYTEEKHRVAYIPIW